MVSNTPPTLKELSNMADKRFYQTGYLIADFTVEKWGKQKWVELIQNHGNIVKTLDITKHGFETKWMDNVKVKYNL